MPVHTFKFFSQSAILKLALVFEVGVDNPIRIQSIIVIYYPSFLARYLDTTAETSGWYRKGGRGIRNRLDLNSGNVYFD